MKKILLIHGANINYLGKREPEIYGTTSMDDLNAELLQHAKKHNYRLEIFQSNHEGDVIDRIYQTADEGFDGLVMNPAGFTYAGYALRDCIKGVALPYVEIHISNIATRKIHSVLSDVAIGVIFGFGLYGYSLALEALLQQLKD